MSRWEDLSRRMLDEIEQCDPIYRPTSFWGPGVRSVLDDMRRLGLESFKSWPSASTWFYPTYGNRITAGQIDAALRSAGRRDAKLRPGRFRAALRGDHEARRDFDVARLAWDQRRWPFDLDGLGESEAGLPPETFRLGRSRTVFWTRPYLNYLLSLAGLSRHIDRPPRRFLELGGGFGVLGEIVLSRDPEAAYVDLDLPPLLVVASAYLDRLFGQRVTTYENLPAEGPLAAPGSACLPNWRIRDIKGPFDVFVNSFSFQEMEPDVVKRYADDIARLDVTWVVSLNSRAGKPRHVDGRPGGVLSPVTSSDIIRIFEARGYRSVAAYGEPLLHSQGELAILRLDDPDDPAGPAVVAAGSAPAATAAIDLRRPFVPSMRADGRATDAGGLRAIVRRVLPATVLRALRWVRRRTR